MKNNNNNNRTNVSVSYALRRQCYSKGISLFDDRLNPKTQTRLMNECARSGKNLNNIQNFNSVGYGVPPRPERARAIRNADPKLSMSAHDAMFLAADPFYTFKKLRYIPELPVYFNKESIKNMHGHEVWGVLPEFFPGPTNKPAPKPKMKPPVAKKPAAKTPAHRRPPARRDQRS